MAQRMNIESLYEACIGSTVIIETPLGTGSGFVVSNEGYILTNHHVISGAYPRDFTVKFSDGTTMEVQRIEDFINRTKEDLALLKVERLAGRQALPLSLQTDVKPGAEVAVIGSPFGLGFTIVTGVVSNISPGQGLLPNYLIQNSAPVNAGNSGGPVLNRNGQVIGIVVGSFASSRAEGTHFAVKSGSLRTFLQRNNVSFTTNPLILDNELRREERLSEQEEEAIRNAHISNINERRRLDSLENLRNLIERQETLDRELLRNNENRRKDSIQEIERIRQAEEARLQQLLRQEALAKQRQQEVEEQRRQDRLKLSQRVSLKFGLGTQYRENDPGQFGNEFDFQTISPFAQTMLGYRFNVRKRDNWERGHATGLFGQYGLTTLSALSKMIASNSIPVEGVLTDNPHPYYEVEAVIMLGEWFRFGGGQGFQNVETNMGKESHTYYTTTVGIAIRFGVVEIDLNGTGFWGGFISHPAIRANLSLNLHLKAGRW